MKVERRGYSPSPPTAQPKKGNPESWKAADIKSDIFSIPGLSFINPLKNPRTQTALCSKAAYQSPDDNPQDIIIKNVTVAMRIMLFYRDLWIHPDLWDIAAEDLGWETPPEWNMLKKTIICHGKAREAFVEKVRNGLAKPTRQSDTVLKTCHIAIDHFNHEWPHVNDRRYRLSPSQVSRRRQEWADIMKYNPVVLISSDFDPDSTDGRPIATPRTGNVSPLGKVLSFQIPGLPASSKKTEDKARSGSPIRIRNKRAATPEASPRLNKSPRLPEAKDISTHRRNSSTGSIGRRQSIVYPWPTPPTHSATSSRSSPVKLTAEVGDVPVAAASTPSRSLSDGLSAMRMYIKLLSEEVEKVATIDHTRTPDLVVSEIAELQTACVDIQNRHGRVLNILHNQPPY